MGDFKAAESGRGPSEILPRDYEPLKSLHLIAGTVQRGHGRGAHSVVQVERLGKQLDKSASSFALEWYFDGGG